MNISETGTRQFVGSLGRKWKIYKGGGGVSITDTRQFVNTHMRVVVRVDVMNNIGV